MAGTWIVFTEDHPPFKKGQRVRTLLEAAHQYISDGEAVFEEYYLEEEHKTPSRRSRKKSE